MSEWMTMTEAQAKLTEAHDKRDFWGNLAVWNILVDVILFVAVVVLPNPWDLVAFGVLAADFVAFLVVINRKIDFWKRRAAELHMFLEDVK